MKTIKYLLFSIFLLGTTAAQAQTIWNNQLNTEQSTVSAEWVKPSFDDWVRNGQDITFFSSVLFLQGYFPAGNGFSFSTDVPLSHWGSIDDDGFGTEDPHTTIGNIYIGGSYQFSKMANGRLSPSIELGTRLPTMPDPDFPDKRGFITGFYSSFDRLEAFTPNLLPIIGLISTDFQLNTATTLSVSGGASYWTKGELLNEPNQLFLTQRVMLLFNTPEIGGRLGVSGKYNVAPKDALLSELDITQLWAGVDKTISNNWTVEAYIRAPLTESNLHRAFGIKVDFTINP
jgi:hypothetical protein